METLEQLQSIMDLAPDGATEAGKLYDEFIYIDNRDNGHQFKIWFASHNEWVFSELVDGRQYIRGFRLLSDIKRIIELIKINKEMHSQVAGYLSGDDWQHWVHRNQSKYLAEK